MNEKNDSWLVTIMCLLLIVVGGLIVFFGQNIISDRVFANALVILLVASISTFILVVIRVGGRFIRSRIQVGRLKEFIFLLAKHFLPIKPIIAFSGIALLTGGLYFIYDSRPANDFFGAFFSVTGAQIFLWAIGIKFEIFANVPANLEAIKKDKDGSDSISIVN